MQGKEIRRGKVVYKVWEELFKHGEMEASY